MKAVVFKAPDEPLEIAMVADPLPEEGELLLRVRASGICGSDLHMAQVRDRAGGMMPLPEGTILGHEFAGDIAAMGAGVEGWREGERICALPYLSCGRCEMCLSGHGHRCAEVVSTGLGKLAGAYAEYVRVGADQAMRLPESVDYRAGALVEPLAVGLHAVEAAGLQPGDAVLVVGAGPIGAAVTMWARFLGARQVCVSDLSPARAAAAAGFGATRCIDASSENVVAACKEAAGSRPQVIFDCVGVPGSQQLCMDYAPLYGRIVVAGVCMQPDTTIPAKAITKELSLRYVYCYRRQDFEFTLDMLAAGRIDAGPMASHFVDFDGFPAAFEELKKPGDQCKVLLEP